MSLDGNALLLSLFIGLVGLACFIYGKRQARLPAMLIGFVMMAYPYFVSNLLLMAGIAVVLLAGLWLAARQGW